MPDCLLTCLDVCHAVRSDTGPMYVKYNAVLRSSAESSGADRVAEWERLCMGNKYVTAARRQPNPAAPSAALRESLPVS